MRRARVRRSPHSPPPRGRPAWRRRPISAPPEWTNRCDASVLSRRSSSACSPPMGWTWTAIWPTCASPCSNRPATPRGYACSTPSPARTSTPSSPSSASTGDGMSRISCTTPRPPWHRLRRPPRRGRRAWGGPARRWAIMRRMPTQPTLPFGDPPHTPSPAPPPQADAPPTADGTAPDDLSPVSDPPAMRADRDPAHFAYRRPWWARLLGRLLEPWIGLTSEPPVPSQLIDGRPVCYVLEDYGLSNALVLERACRDAGLPSPLRPLPGDPLGRKRAYVALSRRNAGSTLNRAAQLAQNKPPSPVKRHSDSLARLLEAHRADPALDVQLVPVSIFIGRAPDKASGWFSVLFSENWTLVGRFRRLLAILLNGRNTMVRFATPIDLRAIVTEDIPSERAVRKLSRVLRTHFHRIREAVIGPDLSTRRLLIDKVLAADSVKEAIADQARRDNRGSTDKGHEDAWKKAYAFAYEIAADYSHPVVRSASFLLTSVWNRVFRGVLVHHLDELKAAATGYVVVYVPCHRSHMDYLLLSYLLFTRGIVPPHIVAGINLNLPVIGTLLRRGGAFFIRRSIRGSALYSAVLGEYVAQLVAGGYSLEFFVEGGRSRTGRLLQPKGGMVSMTVRGYLRQPSRPVLFQPVYIGYEKLMEGTSYLDELSGKPKQNESILRLLIGIPRVLRQNYGQVVVNFGEPIALDDMLARHAPMWDGTAIEEEDRPDWLSNTVDATALQIQVNINRAADVT